MPSDDRVRPVLEALSGATQAFRSTLARTADEIAQLQRVRGATKEAHAARLAAELGPFAQGRIAVERFATLVHYQPGVNGAGAEVVRRAQATLAELLGLGDELFSATVDAGASLYDAAGAKLAQIGRAFAAARVAGEVQAGQHPLDRHVSALERFPFAQWNRAERRVAPPLVIEVHGSDLRAAGLAEFLDGRVKLVLLVSGETPPASLVRLIAPSVYVQQAAAPADLAGFSAWDGPGIAALVPERAARFVHDPAAGSTPAERLRLAHTPAEPPRKAIGGISAAQQADELAMLATLAQPMPVAGEAPGAAPKAADPAEQLAAWLLAQANLGGG